MGLTASNLYSDYKRKTQFYALLKLTFPSMIFLIADCFCHKRAIKERTQRRILKYRSKIYQHFHVLVGRYWILLLPCLHTLYIICETTIMFSLFVDCDIRKKELSSNLFLTLAKWRALHVKLDIVTLKLP